MEIARYLGGWNFVGVPQKRFLSVMMLSAAISACPAMAEDGNAVPIGEAAQDYDSSVHVDEPAPETPSWRSRTRYLPIETLVSDNLQQLRANAEAVFVGELTGSVLENDEEGSVPITRYDFAVETYLKGESSNNGTISLRNIGGRSERSGATVSTHFSFDFVVGERYLVFLRPDFAKSTLPIIFALSVHEGGDVLANENGQQLVRLNEEGEMGFSAAASYSPLNYRARNEESAKTAPGTTEMPAPSPGRGAVEIMSPKKLSSTVKDVSDGLSEGVPLDSVVEQILD